MECWNFEFAGMGSAFIEGRQQKLKSDRYPRFNTTIPYFHHSTIPWVIWRSKQFFRGKVKI